MSTKFRCSSGKVASYICVSKNCQQHAFICDNTSCCGKDKHSGCSIQFVENFSSIETIGSKDFQMYVDKISVFYNNLLELIKNHRQQFRQWAAVYDRNYKKLLEQKKSEIKTIFTGNQSHKLFQAWTCFSSEHNKQHLAEAYKLDKNISKDLNLIKKMMMQNCKRAEDERRTSTTQYLQVDSNILWKDEDQKTLLRFFLNENKIKEINRLYRASSFNFLVSKFHQLCDGIPNTLTIVKNSKNMIYGGFSIPAWEQDQIGKYKSDNSGKSFVFSITNDEKFQLFEKEYAIQCNKFCGPRFGRVSVVSIYDKANANHASWYILPSSYHHPNEQWTNKNYEAFLGVEMYEKYTIEEWQVFEVVYQS